MQFFVAAGVGFISAVLVILVSSKQAILNYSSGDFIILWCIITLFIHGAMNAVEEIRQAKKKEEKAS